MTPWGLIVVVAGALPAVAIAVGLRRAASVRAALRLRAPRHGTDLPAVAALLAVFALLAVAAAQPSLAHATRQRVRTDAQALFVIDTSRSMAAASGPTAPTRLARAERLVAILRGSIPDVAAGIATLTDRVLPDLLPVPDGASFDLTLSRVVGVDRPPPRAANVVATSFDALVAIPTSGFFERSAKRRVVVLVTDGESRPFEADALGRAFADVGLIVLGVRRTGELVFDGTGRAEPGYRPDAAAPAALAAAAAATGGRPFHEEDLGPASSRLRRLLGKGPTRSVVDRSRRETPLAPIVALGALLPLAFLIRRRSAGSAARTASPPGQRTYIDRQ